MNNIPNAVIYLALAILILGIFKLIKKYFDNSKTVKSEVETNFTENIDSSIEKDKITKTMNYKIKPNSKINPMSVQEFNKELEHWLNNNENDKSIGSINDYGGRAFLYIKNKDKIFHLNADTKKEAVKKYISKFKNEKWIIVFNARKTKKNKVAFGSDDSIIPGFYLYLL